MSLVPLEGHRLHVKALTHDRRHQVSKAWCRVVRHVSTLDEADGHPGLQTSPQRSASYYESRAGSACIELGISDTDRSKRETVAILMAPLAKKGHASIDQMKTFAVAQFRMRKPH
jgi:hypothetical protein